MTPCATVAHPAGLAFNAIAHQYDDLFTKSLIGRAQRNAVWNVLGSVFRSGERVLELNCGTGEDALFLARKGVSVYACDASDRMILVAAARMAREPRGAMVQLEVRATEDIGDLARNEQFDGVLSNFSGLNCVADLSDVARQLATLVRPGGHLVFCFSTRFCAWEVLWFLAHARPGRAFRRWKGSADASLGSAKVTVHYPRLKDIQIAFRPWFRLIACKGIGVTVPPSYMEHVAQRYWRLLKKLERVDNAISALPGIRIFGDHMLLVLERTES